ncbi:MAG: response regulator, partial [Gammaproteobacteria bacterium]
MNTILILDDEDVVRQSFVDYFEDNLWRVVQAETAEQALDLLETEQPEVALVDIRLPGIDGDEFIREAIERQ